MTTLYLYTLANPQADTRTLYRKPLDALQQYA